MNALELIILVVPVLGLLAAIFGPLRFDQGLASIGRTGSMWFDHNEDLPLADQPSEDDNDAPLPIRPLRTRAR